MELERSAGRQLAAAPAGVETLFVTGPRPPAGWLAWALDELELAADWSPADPYLDTAFPVLRYRAGDRRLEIHRAEQWFGAGPHRPAELERAWSVLGRVIGQHFRGATLLATPATTGRALFLRTIPPGVEYPVLSDELQHLIRSTSTQGRIETLPAPRPRTDDGLPLDPELDALYEYDGRFMYAALCWGMPIGVPTHDAGSLYLNMTPARYRVRVTVPRDWREPFGLFGVRDGAGDEWRYPATPGETFSTWIDGAELHVAHTHAPAWFRELRILERLHWPNDTRAQHEPLKRWAELLVAARDLCDLIAEAGDRAAAERAAFAVRALLLHGVGAFQGRPQIRTGFAELDSGANIPTDALGVRLDESGRWLIYERPALEAEAQPWRAALAHPEWCAQIWARARARLLAAPGRTGALYRTAGEVVAFRTDAIYLTERQQWTGEQVGRFRLKSVTTGPLPWPSNSTALLEMRDQ